MKTVLIVLDVTFSSFSVEAMKATLRERGFEAVVVKSSSQRPVEVFNLDVLSKGE